MARFIRTAHLRRAFVIPLAIILFTLFLTMVAFAVDLGYINMSRSELRAAVDAANLAGASGLQVSPAEARARAKSIAASNKVGGKSVVLQDSDIELGRWDTSTKKFTLYTGSDESKASAMRITARMNKERGNALGLIFAPLIGTKTKDLTISAVAGFGLAADIVIVQDITSSFDAELADAKVGDQALIDALYANGAGKSSIGYVVHTGWGKTLGTLKPVNTEYNNLKSLVTNTLLCGNKGMPVCSGTDIGAGLEEALKVYADTNYVPVPGIPKAIILVSDGEPNVSSDGSHPKMTNAQLLTYAQQQSDAAWAKGIHVYVVFFNRDNDQAASAKVATLARGNGDFVQVQDPKKLPEALEGITRRLPMALLQ